MVVESFLDYGEVLKVIFDINEEEVNYSFICEQKDENLSSIIIENLKNISKLSDLENSDMCRLSINDTIFININKKTGKVECINKLTSFETRLLAQSKTKNIPFSRDYKSDFLPKTDLHTHFAGALTTESLIEVGKKHNLKYPSSLLKKIGIDINKYDLDKDGNIEINTIDELDIIVFKNALKISPITQETFNKMEEIYTLRGPFTKNSELFPGYLRALAEDYKKCGVEYAELSFSAFLTNSDYMQMLEDNLPQIEKDTGVKLRFLAGMWRHSDQEWNLDDTDRLIKIAKSPYIVGCDFMGHETNSTDTFMEELQMLSRYAMQEDPNFAIRVHAGENPMFKDNVKKALQIVYNEHKQFEEQMGKKFPMPYVRIGHGLYGVDEHVLDMAKEMGAIIEFNMSSNLALNNINSISEIPIKKYVDSGIDVVLGTDGHGMYSTFGGQEVLLASAAGLAIDDLAKMKTTEQKVIDKALEREKSHPKITNVYELYDNIRYTTFDGSYRYTKEVEENYKLEKRIASKRLGDQIFYTGAITDEKLIEEETKGKIPIMLTGASKSNWPNILPKDQEYIRLTMQVLANVLNPETTYVVTGGTNFGVEKTMHEAINVRNKKKGNTLILLGTFTMEAANEKDEGIEPDTITHATILELDGRKANNWMELPDTQLEYVKERNGYMIAVGGGSIVNDMIQRAHNLGVNMHLMNGPYGASTNKSNSLSGNDYSFETIEQLLKRLYSRNQNLFIKDFSLENIESYIKEAKEIICQKQEIGNNPANFGLGAIAEIDQSVTYQERVNGFRQLEQEQKKIIDESEVIHNDIGI